MPYKPIRENGKWVIRKVKPDGSLDGKAGGEHDSRESAMEQIRAMMANEKVLEVEDKRSAYGFPRQYNQLECNYMVPAQGNEVCGNCRFYDSTNGYNPCLIVENERPYAIVPNGYCNKYAVLPVEDVEIELGEDNEPVKPPVYLSRLMSTIRQLNNKFASQIADLILNQKRETMVQGFKVLEDGRWLAWWSNNFKDKENEIISEKALRRFIDMANSGKVKMPELWWMHIPGTRHGQAKKLFYLGHFALAVGNFDDKNMLTKTFKSWYKKHPNVTMSHGFWYDSKYYHKNSDGVGVYEHVLPYEISTLKAGYEANPYTLFEVRKAYEMSTIDDKMKDLLKKEFGDDFAVQVINAAEEMGKQTREAGVDFKSIFGKADMPMMDSEDDTEEDKKKPKKSTASEISLDTMLILSGLQTLGKQFASQAVPIQQEHDKANKQSNQLDAIFTEIDNVNAQVERINKTLLELRGRQTAASKSEQTLVDPNHPQAAYLAQKNNEGQERQKSVLEQMQDMSFGGVKMPSTDNGNQE